MEVPKFKVPFTAMCAGPTMAGKTLWIKKFILNSSVLMDKKPDLVLYYYSEWQPAYNELIQHGVTFIKGVPDLDELRQMQHSCTLMVLDDLMQELQKHPALVSLFTRGCHHLGISLFHITQNIFFENLRTARINTQYLVLMKSLSDKLQVHNLARQLYPGCTKFFIESYCDATKEPYKYLVVDLNMTTDEKLRLRTNIFPDEWPIIVYGPKSI